MCENKNLKWNEIVLLLYATLSHERQMDFAPNRAKNVQPKEKKRKKTVEAVTNAEIFDAIWCPG